MKKTTLNAKILIVDDDKLVMIFYVKALVRQGAEVEICFDGDSAINRLHNEPFDLVVLDMMMPSGERYKDKDTRDGLTTGVFIYEEITQMWPKVPVIVLTNVTNEDTLNLLPESARKNVHQKSKTPPSRLAEKIEEMLNQTATDDSIPH